MSSRVAPWVIGAWLACTSCGSGNEGNARLRGVLVERGIDLDALFAPPTHEELAALRAAWRAVDSSPQDVREEGMYVLDEGDTLHVLSHRVGDLRHYGVVIEPPGDHAPGSLPVVANLIGFGGGMRLEVPRDATAYDGAYVTVFPSFRGHLLQYGNNLWRSEGNPFDQCDGGTDDALAFLEVALESTPSADPERLALLGGSRGGNVAMMLSIRRGDIDGVVNVAGPTDYLHEELLDHPNLTRFYEDHFVAELLDGGTDLDEARARMLSCSPLYFAERLPALQVHHGTADQNVPFEQAELLAQHMNALGRTAPLYELFVYEGADHRLADHLGDVVMRIDAFVESRLRF